MSNILLIISIILTLICYIIIFISSLTSKNGSETAYEAVIRLTKEDNGLRLVESKDNILNKYQLKRKIINQMVSNIALIGLLDIMKHPEILVIKKCKFYGLRY